MVQHILQQLYVRKCHVAVKQLLSDDWVQIQGDMRDKSCWSCLAWCSQELLGSVFFGMIHHLLPEMFLQGLLQVLTQLLWSGIVPLCFQLQHATVMSDMHNNKLEEISTGYPKR